MKRLINKLGIIAFSFNLFLDINAADIQTVEANAQYGPKVWSMYFQAENEERGQEMDIIIEGDSMFNGRKYLLAIINVGSNDPTERDTLLYRQEGGKVIFVPKGQEQEEDTHVHIFHRTCKFYWSHGSPRSLGINDEYLWQR